MVSWKVWPLDEKTGRMHVRSIGTIDYGRALEALDAVHMRPGWALDGFKMRRPRGRGLFDVTLVLRRLERSTPPLSAEQVEEMLA